MQSYRLGDWVSFQYYAAEGALASAQTVRGQIMGFNPQHTGRNICAVNALVRTEDGEEVAVDLNGVGSIVGLTLKLCDPPTAAVAPKEDVTDAV